MLFSEKIEKIKNFADQNPANGSKDVSELINTAIVPGFLAGLSSLACLFCFLTAYFYLLFTFIDFFSNQVQAKALTKLARAIWCSIRYGLGLVLIGWILHDTVIVVAPFLIFLILPLMLSPAIAILDKRGVFSSIWIALRCSFTSQQRFPMYMQVCGIGALFYLSLTMNNYIFYWIKDVDHYFAVPRAAQILNFGSESLSLNLAIAVLVEVCIRASIIALLVATSVCFYLRVRRMEAFLQKAGVQNYA